MKPLYIFLILYALFITGFADVLELIFATIIPGAGIIIGIPVAMCINITMGAGLIFLLAQNGMFHPKFGPAGIVASVIPGIDSLPIWLGLVIAGILQKMAEEDKGLAGVVAATTVSASSISLNTPKQVSQTARTVGQGMQNRPRITPQGAQSEQRAPLDLKSPRMNDIKKPYVQKAA